MLWLVVMLLYLALELNEIPSTILKYNIENGVSFYMRR